MSLYIKIRMPADRNTTISKIKRPMTHREEIYSTHLTKSLFPSSIKSSYKLKKALIETKATMTQFTKRK